MSQHPTPKEDPKSVEVATHEDNDLVDSVDELRWEMTANRSHHQFFGL